MSIEVIVMQHAYEHQPLTALDPVDNSTTDSDSDGGYGTPAEHFADDETERPLTPPESAPPAAVATEAKSTAEEETVAVDSELRERIIKQVEHYFSDENLLKDSFLMKHINRNKQGFVSLKLVASFRKVKSLTKDWRAVLESIRHSSFLALNEDETKVRRTSPPPQIDYSHISRTIIVSNYPDSEPNVNTIEDTFGKYGEVSLVRILHPGKAVPLDIKPCRSKYPNLGKELHVLVEYESKEAAKHACTKFNAQQSWRDEMKVELLEKDEQEVEKSTTTPKNLNSDKKNRKKAGKQEAPPKGRQGSPSRFAREGSPSSHHSREESPARQVFRKYSPPDHYQRRGHVKCSPEFQRKFLHPDAWKDYASDSGYSARSPSQSPKMSPEPPRRFFSGDVGPSWRSNEKHVHVQGGCVTRQPLGPDGTRGFYRPGRPVRISVDSC